MKNETLFGGFSEPSKMPWIAWGTSPLNCPRGRVLREIPGTVCGTCYAHCGRMAMPAARRAQQRRSRAVCGALWAESIGQAIERKARRIAPEKRFFRWMDSGDVESLAMLAAIYRACELSPSVRHWLPTRERGILRAIGRKPPANLIIRVSSDLIGQGPLKRYPHTSTVDSGVGLRCSAYERDHTCGPCRACWDASVPNIDYPLH